MAQIKIMVGASARAGLLTSLMILAGASALPGLGLTGLALAPQRGNTAASKTTKNLTITITNDPTVQREIYRQLGQFVVPTKSDLGEQVPAAVEPKIETPTSGVKKCDVLICHATEDKGYAEPLAEALQEAGISPWYDRFSLQWGDDLRRKIDEGLKDCAFGIVVFSPAFLKIKKWTEYELSGLFAKEKVGAPPVILPILHNITIEDLAAYAPSLSTRLAKNSSTDSIEDIIKALKSMLGRTGLT